MKRTLTQTILDNAPLAVGTFYTRTTPARGAARVVLAIRSTNPGTGTVVVNPRSLEGAYADAVTDTEGQESGSLSLVSSTNPFSAAVVLTAAWQYVGVHSVVGNAPSLASKFVRFRITTAVAEIPNVTMKLITIFDEEGAETDENGELA